MLCEPNKASKTPRKPNFYWTTVVAVLRTLSNMWLNVIQAKFKSSQCWSAKYHVPQGDIRDFLNRTCCVFKPCAVVYTVSLSHTPNPMFFLLFLPPPPPPPSSLVNLVIIGLVSISTDLVSVMVPGGWLPLAELPWIPVCPAQGLWLEARCSPISKLICWWWF